MVLVAVCVEVVVVEVSVGTDVCVEVETLFDDVVI